MSSEKIEAVKRPRPHINDAVLIDIDDDEGVDLWRLRKEIQAPCPKCPGGKWHFHDIYVEVGGDAITTFKFFRVCRDCQYEEEIALKNINEAAKEQKIKIFQNERR